MKRIKKLLAVMLLSLTLFNSIFASYSMTIQAAEAIPVTMTVLESLLSLFGVEIGLGNQFEFFSNQKEIQEECEAFLEAAANGKTYNMSVYGDVDFNNSESILSWMTWAQKCLRRAGGNSLVDVAFDSSILTLAKALDSTSYKNTGTLATNSIESMISEFVGDYNGSSEALAEEVQKSFTVITGGNGSGDNGDDDQKKTLTKTFWKMFGVSVASFLIGGAAKYCNYLDTLKTPEETEFQEYDSAFSDADGFVPGASLNNFSYTADPSYSNYSSHKVVVDVGIINNRFIQKIVPASYVKYGACFILDPYMKFYCLNNNQVLESKNYTSFIHIFESDTFYYSTEGFFNQNEFTDCGYVSYIPVFSDITSAYAFFNEGDTSGILNLVDDSAYTNFKKVAPSSYDSLSKNINKWMDTNPSVDSFPDAVSDILDASDSVVGTGDAVPAVDDAIAEKAGVTSDSDTETDTGTSTNYMGILGKILNAILKLVDICNFFNNPLASILLNWQQLLQWLQDFKIWIENAWADLLTAIAGTGEPKNPWGTVDGSGDGSSGGGAVNLINGLLMLLSILYILLCIFLHLLEFIINIFKIPAYPGFIEGDFAIGFEYIKTVQLSPLSISVYDFLMGLVHILLFFSIVKVLKRHIDKIHI